MSSIHSPLNPPGRSLASTRKKGLSRRQTIACIGLLLMAGPLGIAAQHVEWRQWIADQRMVIDAQKHAAPAPACFCSTLPCR